MQPPLLPPACRVYRRLDALSSEPAPGPGGDDGAGGAAAGAGAAEELMELLGPGRIGYLQLVHQLIVCEEAMAAGW